MLEIDYIGPYLVKKKIQNKKYYFINEKIKFDKYFLKYFLEKLEFSRAYNGVREETRSIAFLHEPHCKLMKILVFPKNMLENIFQN